MIIGFANSQFCFVGGSEASLPHRLEIYFLRIIICSGFPSRWLRHLSVNAPSQIIMLVSLSLQILLALLRKAQTARPPRLRLGWPVDAFWKSQQVFGLRPNTFPLPATCRENVNSFCLPSLGSASERLRLSFWRQGRASVDIRENYLLAIPLLATEFKKLFECG